MVQRTDDRFQSILLQSPVAMCILKGPALTVEIANARMFALWGIGPDELLNRRIFQGLPEEGAQEMEELIQRVYTTGKPLELHERRTLLRRPGGAAPFYLNLTCDVFRDEAGTITGVIVVAADVTTQVLARRKVEENAKELQERVSERTSDLKEQEALINSILRNSPVGITVYRALRDSTGRLHDFQCILANDASAEFTGIPVSERYSRTVLETIPGLEEAPLFKMAVAAVEAGKSFETEYYYEPVKKWLSIGVAKIYEDHLINIFRDITDIKGAKLQLEAQIEQLERMNVNLSHFTYAASHDMKEPLRKVLIFADRLKESLESKLDPEQQHYLNRIESATKRMNFLIDDLLTYHEVSGRIPAMEPVNLDTLVQNVLDDLDLEIAEKHAQVHVAPLFTMYGHARQLQQVFHNLIGNALKYSRPDIAPEIRITCKKVVGNQTTLRLRADQLHEAYYMLSISDNGIGFDQDDAARIFNVFERLPNSKSYEGTGLGLPIVRKVVENHNGFIMAQGALGAGATFSVLFPQQKV